MARIYSLLVGVFLLVVSVTGFMRHAMYGLLLYPAPNVIHLATGVLGLWAALGKSPKRPQTFSQAFGAIYTLGAIAGFVGLHDIGAMRLGSSWKLDIIHLALGLLGMLVGFAGPVTLFAFATVAIAGYASLVVSTRSLTLFPRTPVSVPFLGAMSAPAPAPAVTPIAFPDPTGRSGNGVRLKLVSGRVVQTRCDCGGINPAQEFLGPSQKDKPDPKKAFYIRKGTVNSLSNPILREVSPDVQGNFEVALPPGRYCVVGESKKDALKIPDLTEVNKKLAQSRVPGEPLPIVSEQCFRDWWRTCDQILQVRSRND